ncbi:MAG TPA: creatininase family protein [Chloroflexota bacterium]|nr:creatininase family protein [Chloroflexota bacterium]
MGVTLPSVWLNELTWEEVAAYLATDDIVLWPIGSTEQHGPGGPLGVDTYVAIMLAEDAARRANVLCVPPLWYGDSSHHLGFPGTLSLRTETLMLVVRDVAHSLAKHGFRKILIINGHKGANLPGLLAATKNLREFELPEVFFAVIDPMKLARGIAPQLKETPEHHCGELEISHVWYRYPELIRADRLTDDLVPFEEIFGEFSHNDLLAGGGDTIDIPWTSAEQRRFAPTGAFTPSRKASPEKGRRFHEYQVENIVRFIQWLRTYQGPLARRPAVPAPAPAG